MVSELNFKMRTRCSISVLHVLILMFMNRGIHRQAIIFAVLKLISSNSKGCGMSAMLNATASGGPM